MRFAGEEELAARGLGDGCGDLMFFSSVLDFFIYYGSLVVSYRLVPPSRSCVPWSVSPFLPAVSLLARIVLISSRAGVSSGISFLISFYRLVLLACLVLLIAFPGVSRSIPVLPCSSFHRVVLPGRLACSSRFLFIRLVSVALRI